MKIGLFFGSFNPIHIGHLIIANYILEYSDLEKIWFVVSPQNPFKKKESLLDSHHRLQMVRLAINNYPNMVASDIEFSLPYPSYTIDTLAVLNDRYPDKEFVLLMGKDNLNSFTKWKNYDKILSNYPIIVYPRKIAETENLELLSYPQISSVNAPIIELSATLIRKMIKEKKNFRPMLPPEVFDYIDGSNLYSS